MTIQPTSFKIVSGGQTGADQAGLRAARAAGINGHSQTASASST